MMHETSSEKSLCWLRNRPPLYIGSAEYEGMSLSFVNPVYLSDAENRQIVLSEDFDPESRELARRALESNQKRADEDIDSWAKRLAQDIAQAND